MKQTSKTVTRDASRSQFTHLRLTIHPLNMLFWTCFQNWWEQRIAGLSSANILITRLLLAFLMLNAYKTVYFMDVFLTREKNVKSIAELFLG
jgi:hypothetical protein